jgi:hypothetical protein
MTIIGFTRNTPKALTGLNTVGHGRISSKRTKKRSPKRLAWDHKKVAMLAALGAVIMLIMLSADVGPRHRQTRLPSVAISLPPAATSLPPAAISLPPVAIVRESPKTEDATAVEQSQPVKVVAKISTNGFIISSKTGARARVGVRYAARFQAYIDDLEKNHGARILFMGGIRPGHCSISSEHPCGRALDVCQLRRGAVDRRCKLPGRVVLGQIAASHGLFEGGRWCSSDYGHAQVGGSATACGSRHVRTVQKTRSAPEKRAQIPQDAMALR